VGENKINSHGVEMRPIVTGSRQKLNALWTWWNEKTSLHFPMCKENIFLLRVSGKCALSLSLPRACERVNFPMNRVYIFSPGKWIFFLTHWLSASSAFKKRKLFRAENVPLIMNDNHIEWDTRNVRNVLQNFLFNFSCPLCSTYQNKIGTWCVYISCSRRRNKKWKIW
jgi:hypothetical protein